MAHNPIAGTGITMTTGATSAATTSFTIRSPYVRLTARGEGAHVAISQTSVIPTATITDYYIPAGTSGTLSMSRYSQKVVGITQGSTTIITCPEGQQTPFNVGNYVTLVGANDVNYDNLIKHSLVTAVNNTAGVDGYHQTRVTVDADTSGISTDFDGNETNSDATLYSSARVAARSDGGAAALSIIQVQVSGDA